MKVESLGSKQMLHKGVSNNSENYTKEKETERQKMAVEPKQKVSTFSENKGTYFDAKA